MMQPFLPHQLYVARLSAPLKTYSSNRSFGLFPESGVGGGESKLALREKTWRMSRFVDSLFQMGGFENERDPIDKAW